MTGPGSRRGRASSIPTLCLDLAEEALGSAPLGSGLAVIRGLAEQIGAKLGYKRDPSWD